MGEWSASRRDRFALWKEGPYRWSRFSYFEEEENLTMPEFELRTVKPVASRYTDFVIQTAVYIWNKIGCHNSFISAMAVDSLIKKLQRLLFVTTDKFLSASQLYLLPTPTRRHLI